ncbi:Mitotic-spindle organizing protein 1 [Trichoplax sp. H2]|nr:Mitotic-spindle organizing protein 1 [Trichoplax sp. H2]|eukprot:RDD43504.1 Mitotic-spindle organizing protein 1 [Trichoplax sp. H2]
MAEKSLGSDGGFPRQTTSNVNVNAAVETLDIVQEISDLLNTGLDRKTLSICVQLCEAGINPEALAFVIQELRRETQKFKVIMICADVIVSCELILPNRCMIQNLLAHKLFNHVSLIKQFPRDKIIGDEDSISTNSSSSQCQLLVALCSSSIDD